MHAYIGSTRSFRKGGGACCNDLYGASGGGAGGVASCSTLVLFNGLAEGSRVVYGLRQSTLINWSISRLLYLGGYGYCRLAATTCACACACHCCRKGWEHHCLPRRQWKRRWLASVKWKGDVDDYDSSEDGEDCEMMGLLGNASERPLIDGRCRSKNTNVHVSRSKKNLKTVESRSVAKVLGRVDSGDKSLKDESLSRSVEKYRKARKEGSWQFDSGSSYYSASSGGDFENSLDLISAAERSFNGESDAEVMVKLEDDARMKEQKFVGDSSPSSEKKEVQARTGVQKRENKVVKSSRRKDVDKEILDYQLQESQDGSISDCVLADRVETKEETSSSFVHSMHNARKQSILKDKAYTGREESGSKRVEERLDIHLDGRENASISEKASTSRITEKKVTNNSALLSMEKDVQHDIKDSVKLESMEGDRMHTQKYDTSENQTQIVARSQRYMRKKHALEEEMKRQGRTDINVITQLNKREESKRLASGSGIHTTSASSWEGTTNKKESMDWSEDFGVESTNKYSQTVSQSNMRHGSRMESQRFARSSLEMEKTSSSHMMVKTKSQKQEKTSTEELSEEARKQQSEFSKEVERLPQQRSKSFGSSSSLKSSSFRHDSSAAEVEKNREKNSAVLVEDGLLASADRLDKSSKHLVGEFVDKAKKEISYTHGLIVSSKEEKYKREEHNINVNFQMNLDDFRQSSSSDPGPKGPSDEMWSEEVPSSVAELPGKGNDSPKGAEGAKTLVDAGSTVGKKTSRSLWGFLGDVVRIWSPRSEARKPTTKSNARSSSNESAASETWFSGNEPDVAAADDDKSRRAETVSGQKGTSNVSSRDQSLPSSSSQNKDATGSPDKENEAEVDSITSFGSNGIKIPPDVPSGTVVSESFLPMPVGADSSMLPIELAGSSLAISMPVSPRSGSVASPMLSTHLAGSSSTISVPVTPRYPDKEVPEIGEADVSVNDSTIVNVDPIEEKQIELMGTEVHNTELKRRKLQRNKQVLKERFDEWEEAFKLEQEQHKMDEMFMREALVEAKKAADSWEVPVGAVLVQHGKIVARGCNL